MSSTHKAANDAPFRQERFSSSTEFERGLMGNLVARRAELLTAAADRELVWFLQLLSHAPGGLEKLASDLIEKYPARIATREMQRLGLKQGQTCGAEKVKAIRDDLPQIFFGRQFLLKGELPFLFSGQADDESTSDYRLRCADEGGKHPGSYPASDFISFCLEAANEQLAKHLFEICLDPKCSLAAGPWYFPELIDTLREIQSAWTESKRAVQVITELGRQVYDTLDYCLETACMVLIDGLARTGKTFSAKGWCDLHPGQVRYVQVPSSNDDIAFFRAIAKSLGVSINQNSKAQQLRDRIEDVLQRGKLTVVFDEAHYLWPQSNYRDALPGRVNWIMTALVNHGIGCALVTTPQFMRTQRAVERKSCWTSEQFTGRIGHYQKLPDALSPEDLAAVARAFVPEGCPKSIELLVAYAQGSAKYLAAIEAAARRARFLAAKAKRQKIIFADIKSAIKESVIPSDTALAMALAEQPTRRRARSLPAPAHEETLPVTTAAQMPARRAAVAAPALETEHVRQDLAAA